VGHPVGLPGQLASAPSTLAGQGPRKKPQPARSKPFHSMSSTVREVNTVPHECRRVVTGHTPEGKSAVLYDLSLTLVAQDSAASSARQEDRAGAASRVMWTTQGFPADNDETSDAGLRQVGTAQSEGTVFRAVEYAPGVTPRQHRTDSIDYAIVMSGSIELALDNDTVRLATGDTLVQRGTIHNWINNGTEPCVIAFILIAANPATANGTPLPAAG